MADLQNNNSIIPNSPISGMNTDMITSQLKDGQVTFALNAIVENFDGNEINYQNEQGNYKISDLRYKDNYRVIGRHLIPEQSKIIYFLVNPITSDSEIGFKMIGESDYHIIINAKCLNFNVNYPILKVSQKTTNCSTQLYWTDNYNTLRWIDLDNLPYDEIPDPNKEGSFIKLSTIDCNKLQVQPDFSIPTIIPESIEVGGNLQMGSYQFAIQYSNSLGEAYTSMYGISNPMGIFESKETQSFDLPTTKAIGLTISNIDVTGLYDYFNLIVIKTINNITTPYIAGVFPIVNSIFNTVYTGNDQTEIRLSMSDVFDRYPYYDLAADVTNSDNVLVWSNLKVQQKINYQSIWSKVEVFWETYKIPVNKFEAYNNPINTSEYRGYMRDEVYALEGCFILKNGKITERFPIPGRASESYDLEIIDNEDAINYKNDPCEDPIPRKRWEVYNTASVIDYSEEYKNAKDITCYKGSYQYGKMGYWESSQRYPNNVFIWGELANTPIRHHKFPDYLVSPIHDNNITNDESFQHSIFPIGIKINEDSLYSAIDSSNLTEEEKSQIVGFKILRGNRATNKSVVAKGMLFNVGKYTRDSQDYLYPNYDYNDLRPDPFISTSLSTYNSGKNESKRLDGFGIESKSRYTFHSPDTSFYQPFGIDSGYLKLESVEYGKSKGHFVPVEDNAKYQFMTPKALMAAFGVALSSIVSLDSGGGFLGVAPSATLMPGNVPPNFIAMLDIIKGIIPFINYAYQYNSIGNYNSSIGVENNGNKIRAIQSGSYLVSGMQTVDGERVNNYRRESSIYIKTMGDLLFPHEISGVPIDNSRFTLSSDGDYCDSPSTIRYRDISSYYASIKKIVPDQYGRIHSYEIIDTGYYHRLYTEEGKEYIKFPTVFGGDIFINQFAFKRKHSFFLDNTVSKPNSTDIALNLLGNIGYPIYYYSTNQIDAEFNTSAIDDHLSKIVEFSAGNIIRNIVSGGTTPVIAGMLIMASIFKGYIDVLGVPNINLDCVKEKNLNYEGKMYLFSYGIPYFFTESEVNVDYRQAYNTKEGDFFPHVSSDIPDNWLQEINVPIIQDNTYVYNKSYSKQNKETYFNYLREDFDPSKLCTIDFPNRAIYSQQANLEETKNNWLVYRPISKHEFPKNYGKLVSLDGLESRSILARFENKSQLYNVMSSINTTTGTAYLGNPLFFSQPPIDFAETDTGYAGSQHKFLLKTEFGHLFADSIRGQIFLLRGNQVKEISDEGMSKWFTENLSFNIKDYYPDVNIDNHYKDIGLTGVYDTKYNRFIITKRDYIPLNNNIIYDSELKEFKIGDNIISVDNTEYFCNKSTTISYSLTTQSWVSFHSYIPNYYVGTPGFFETGILEGSYVHSKGIKFNTYYGKIYDYIIEYPIKMIPNEDIISSFSDYTTITKYTSEDIFYEVESGVYFNQAIIYNNFQNSGLLNLIFKPKNDLSAFRKYPKINVSSKDILYSKSDSLFKINTFWDIIKDKSKPCFSIPCNYVSLDKQLDNSNLDYSIRSHNKARIRSREARIRLIYNQSDDYKLTSKFLLTETQKSIK